MHLVFVHLGSSPAPHLWLNIKRIKLLFPELPVTLIYSKESFIKKDLIEKISYYKYTENQHSDSPLNNLAHNTTFRDGFWRYSVERLFALAEWHSLNPEEGLIHLESDILIMPNFPFLEISKITKLAWCSFNDSHDVASIVYLPTATQTKWLVDHLNEVLSSDSSLTDMTALREIAKSFSDRILYLNSKTNELKFEGLFDAAPFGMWLCGRDPRNYWGFVRRFMELPESDIQVKNLKFYFSKDEFLFVKDLDNQRMPLYNLHVHSKTKSLFGTRWKEFLKLQVITSGGKFPSTWFSLSAFYKIVTDYRNRNKDLNLIQLCMKALAYK